MSILDEYVNDARFLPWHGWHDDHRKYDHTSEYLPAAQQNRTEFHDFIELFNSRDKQSCLQLGLGRPGGTHFIFSKVFSCCYTIEYDPGTVSTYTVRIGADDRIFTGNTHDIILREHAAKFSPFDLLFIDAGHLYNDVRADFIDYSPLVKPGGVVAFHDALFIPGNEGEGGVGVWRVIDELRRDRQIHMIGNEVGIAWFQWE